MGLREEFEATGTWLFRHRGYLPLLLSPVLVTAAVSSSPLPDRRFQLVWEGACALLISQLKHAASRQALDTEEAQLKSRIMQRILINDAEIRQLAEPWLEDLDNLLAGRPKTLH